MKILQIQTFFNGLNLENSWPRGSKFRLYIDSFFFPHEFYNNLKYRFQLLNYYLKYYYFNNILNNLNIIILIIF